MRKKARTLDVTIAGIAVRVTLDEDGRPLFATAAQWGDEDLRLALAVQRVFDRTEHAAKSTQRKRNSSHAAAQSAQTRAKASADHWTNQWLALAHDAHPKYGKDKLAQRARSLAALGFIDPDGTRHVVEDQKKRDEITVERARQFLERKRKPPA